MNLADDARYAREPRRVVAQQDALISFDVDLKKVNPVQSSEAMISGQSSVEP